MKLSVVIWIIIDYIFQCNDRGSFIEKQFYQFNSSRFTNVIIQTTPIPNILVIIITGININHHDVIILTHLYCLHYLQSPQPQEWHLAINSGVLQCAQSPFGLVKFIPNPLHELHLVIILITGSRSVWRISSRKNLIHTKLGISFEIVPYVFWKEMNLFSTFHERYILQDINV